MTGCMYLSPLVGNTAVIIAGGVPENPGFSGERVHLNHEAVEFYGVYSRTDRYPIHLHAWICILQPDVCAARAANDMDIT